MIDQWQPADQNSTQLDLTLLNKLAGLASVLENTNNIDDHISQEELQQARSWIQLSENHWQDSVKQLEAEQRLNIATFYVLAETKLSGWEARDKNPAIWIFRYLKKNKQLPEKDIIKKLKNKTDNRFIPYGSVL